MLLSWSLEDSRLASRICHDVMSNDKIVREEGREQPVNSTLLSMCKQNSKF